jgi:hypothetical protein
VKGFWHSFGTVGAQMESSEVGTFGEVFCFQRSSGATRRDRTGDLLITNQPLCVCTGLEVFVFVCIFNSLDVPRHNQGKCFHAGGGHKNGHIFFDPDRGRAPPFESQFLAQAFADGICPGCVGGEVVNSDTQRER